MKADFICICIYVHVSEGGAGGGGALLTNCGKSGKLRLRGGHPVFIDNHLSFHYQQTSTPHLPPPPQPSVT